MVRVLTGQEIQTVYPQLFRESFGREDNIQAPSVVAVTKKGNEISSFISGYWQDKKQFYIQYAAVLPKFRNPKRNIIIRSALAIMEFIGAQSYYTVTLNTDFVTMKILLALKFSPIGIRQDTGGQLWLEWIKQMEKLHALQ